MLFPVGLAVLLVGFQLPSTWSFLPVDVRRLASATRQGDAWYTRKWPMFLVGCGVTLLTLSVAVSLTLLVPLVAKGILRRANTLPYIAGRQHHDAGRHARGGDRPGNQEGVQVVVAVIDHREASGRSCCS